MYLMKLESIHLHILRVAIFAILLGCIYTANASIVSACKPEIEASKFVGADDKNEWAKRSCEAQSNAATEWNQRISELQNGNNDLAKTISAQDWTKFRESWSVIYPRLKDIEAAASSNQDVPGASNLGSLFGADIGFFLQNAGLQTAGNLDHFSERILAGLDGSNPGAAASAASNLVKQSAERGADFAKGMIALEGKKIFSEFQAVREQKGAERMERLEGSTVSGYVSGFPDRIKAAAGAWIFYLLAVCFLAAWIAHKQRRNPVVVGSTVGLAFLLPSFGMALLLVFAPFIPGWVIMSLTVAATVATYFYSRQVFGWFANRVGTDTVTGKRLNVIGSMIENLRGVQSPSTVASGATSVGTGTHGSASWGSAAEAQRNGHLVAPGVAAGFALARVPDAPESVDKRFRFNGHVVTVAPTGSGKGIGSVIPNLLDYPGSALVLDVKGENAAVTARARQEMGQSVHVVDPFSVNGDDCAAFNVLELVDVNSPDCVSDSAILADALVIKDGKGGDSVHFDESAKNLLQGLILYVSSLEQPELRTLGELRRLLTSNEDEFSTLLAEMSLDDSSAFGIPARAANTLMGMADKERGSVLSTARRNTAFLDDPRIAAALSRSDFDLSEIKVKAMTVYLVMPANRIGPNARFLRLFISSVITSITASKVQPAHRVAFLLDEFGQLGYMQQIEDAVSLMRGYGLAFWVFLQDLSQLKATYPKWQTFLANSAKSFFGTDDYDTAKYISDSLGKATVEFETENSGRNTGSGLSGSGGSMNRGSSTGTSQQFTGRDLLTPDEVMRLGAERPIVLVRGERPYLLSRINYLADKEYQGKFDKNPYH